MGVKNQRFWYQLSKWLPTKGHLKNIIAQIEAYEPRSEGIYYVIKEKEKRVAIFTLGRNY